MAVMLDYAVHDLRQDAGDFFELFVSTGMAARFERGEFGVIAGMSGIELACRVLEISGIPAERPNYRYTAGRSKEFWAGWALAYYQWETPRSFAVITAAMPMKDIIAMCSEYRDQEISDISAGLSWMDNLKIPDHMNDESYAGFKSRLDAAIEASHSDAETSLKRIRLHNKFSQSQLAAVSGVPVRTIQQYEQRQKDIKKAAFESIIKLAAALSCEPSDLIE